MTQQFTPAQLETWAGLGPWEWCENWLYVANYNEHPGPVLWYTANDDGVHAKPDDAALIAAAPDLARLVLERDREIAEWKENAIAFLGPWAVNYAKQIGLPDGHIHHVHYDLLEKAGARLVSFTRHWPNLEGNQ